MTRLKDTKVYNILDFINWYELGELDLKPRYQRNPVWNKNAKSYLIDTILRGLPIPQVFIRQIIDINTMKTKKEVVDGQQRLRAIMEFVEDEFSVMKSHNNEFGNMSYSDLPEESKEEFLAYQLPVEVINTKNDNVIYDMFARLNTNSMTLNKQELRNAQYRGEFKVFIYNFSSKWRDFLNEIGTFNERQFSRMYDVEFFSTIAMMLSDGIIHETQKKIDDFYKKFDDEFLSVELLERKMEKILNIIRKIFEHENFATEYFHRKNYLFTLFATIANQMYDLQGLDCEKNEDYNIHNIDKNIDQLVSNLMSFESEYQLFMDKDLVGIKEDWINKIVTFEQHHRTHTTSIKERIERIEILCYFIGLD